MSFEQQLGDILSPDDLYDIRETIHNLLLQLEGDIAEKEGTVGQACCYWGALAAEALSIVAALKASIQGSDSFYTPLNHVSDLLKSAVARRYEDKSLISGEIFPWVYDPKVFWRPDL